MDHYLQYRPLEDVTWEYQARLSFNKEADETVWFVSLGIDYRYDIFLNGERLYSYEGMYRKVELELTDKLRGDDDILSVIVYPHPKREGAVEGTREEASASCKPPVCYGWDWQPRLLISGMWQEAYIETRKPDYITDCEPFTNLNEDMTAGTIDFAVVCAGDYQIHVMDAEGNTVYSGCDTHIEIKNPKLWWCNGQGIPHLYRWEVKSTSDKKEGTLAFKRVRLVRNIGTREPLGYPKSRYEAVPAWMTNPSHFAF